MNKNNFNSLKNNAITPSTSNICNSELDIIAKRLNISTNNERSKKIYNSNYNNMQNNNTNSNKNIIDKNCSTIKLYNNLVENNGNNLNSENCKPIISSTLLSILKDSNLNMNTNSIKFNIDSIKNNKNIKNKHKKLNSSIFKINKEIGKLNENRIINISPQLNQIVPVNINDNNSIDIECIESCNSLSNIKNNIDISETNKINNDSNIIYNKNVTINTIDNNTNEFINNKHFNKFNFTTSKIDYNKLPCKVKNTSISFKSCVNKNNNNLSIINTSKRNSKVDYINPQYFSNIKEEKIYLNKNKKVKEDIKYNQKEYTLLYNTIDNNNNNNYLSDSNLKYSINSNSNKSTLNDNDKNVDNLNSNNCHIINKKYDTPYFASQSYSSSIKYKTNKKSSYEFNLASNSLSNNNNNKINLNLLNKLNKHNEINECNNNNESKNSEYFEDKENNKNISKNIIKKEDIIKDINYLLNQYTKILELSKLTKSFHIFHSEIINMILKSNLLIDIDKSNTYSLDNYFVYLKEFKSLISSILLLLSTIFTYLCVKENNEESSLLSFTNNNNISIVMKALMFLLEYFILNIKLFIYIIYYQNKNIFNYDINYIKDNKLFEDIIIDIDMIVNYHIIPEDLFANNLNIIQSIIENILK